jgi:hypothetical protein
MANQQTVLEGIVESVTTDLYNQWVVALPQSEKTEEKFKSLQKNAHDTTLFIIQNFMDRFNAAAEELKSKE